MTRKLAKGGIAAVAAGAMALGAVATPAAARDRDDGIGAGEIIAGAVILGGIAAIAGSIGNNRDNYRYNDRYGYNDGRYYNNNRYGYGYDNPRQAVQHCVAAVENQARRAGYRFADVTEIRDVDNRRNGLRVKGRMVVDGSRGYGRYNSQYNRYDRYDRGGRYDNRYNSDSGSFTCDVSRGRVVGLDTSGIRGLR